MSSPVLRSIYRPPERRTLLSDICSFRTSIVLVVTPIALLPLLFLFPDNQNEAKCGYCVGIMAIYWVMETLPLAITALLPMVLYPALGLMTSDAVAQMYLPDTSFLFIGGLMLAVAVQKSKLHHRVALFVLTVVPPQPHWIMIGFMTVTAFLSMWISNTATTALMVPIVNSVIIEFVKSNRRSDLRALTGEGLVEEKHNENSDGRRKSIGGFSMRDPMDIFSHEEHRMAKGLLISVAFAANIGGTGTVTGTPSNLVLMGQIKEIFPRAVTEISFVSWMVFAVPLVILCLIVTWLTLVVMFLRGAPKGTAAVKDKLNEKYDELPPISFAEGAVSFCFFLLLILWVMREPQIIPGFGKFFKKGFVTDATSAMLISILLFAIPDQKPDLLCAKRIDKTHRAKVRGSLLDWKTVQSKFPWSVVLLLGGGFAMAAGVKESNLSHRVGEMMQLLNVLSGNTIMSICILITVFLTNICSNTVTASIFIPIVAELAKSLKINPLYFMMPTAIASSMAFTLPVATPPNAIAFASGLIHVKDMMFSGTVATIECAIISVFVMMSWATFLFDLNTFPEWAKTELVHRSHPSSDLFANTTTS